VQIVSNEASLMPPPGATFTTPNAAPPEVMLTDVALVRQLYASIRALPKLPENVACPAIAGPQYTLTLLQGTTTVMTAKADKGGCGTVTIGDASRPRQATNDFWKQLDQATIAATPLMKPDRVAFATAVQPGKAPESAMVTSAATAQQLYDAILALPRTNIPSTCSGNLAPTYQIVFFSGSQTVPASIGDTCGVVEIDGGFQWRGGRFVMNDAFRNLFQSVLSEANLAPAKPDHLSVSVNTPQTVTPSVNVSDDQVMQELYSQIFQLPETAAQPNCPPVNDKVSAQYRFTTLAITQWGLPLVRIDTYQGTCSYVEMSDTNGPRLQPNQAFWDLIDQVQKP
jgi:hypothetical protein